MPKKCEIGKGNGTRRKTISMNKKVVIVSGHFYRLLIRKEHEQKINQRWREKKRNQMIWRPKKAATLENVGRTVALNEKKKCSTKKMFFFVHFSFFLWVWNTLYSTDWFSIVHTICTIIMHRLFLIVFSREILFFLFFHSCLTLAHSFQVAWIVLIFFYSASCSMLIVFSKCALISLEAMSFIILYIHIPAHIHLFSCY